MQSIIFDLDGTLIDSMPAWKKISNIFLEEYHIQAKEKIYDLIPKMSIDEVALFYLSKYSLDVTTEELLLYWKKKLIDQHKTKVVVKPGVSQFLKKMRGLGIPMCVVTETQRQIVEVALKQGKIDAYFDFILTASEVGAGKTQKDLFEEASIRLKSPAKNTIVFEDALYAIKTAKAAGFPVYAVYDEFSKKDKTEICSLADRYYHSFNEVLSDQTIRYE